MTLEEKIGQLFVMGFRGADVSEESTIAHEIRNCGIGGVILFDKDMVYHRPVNNIESPDQVRKLVETLQGYASTPLLVSIDQEGGNVNRLKPEYGFPPTRSHFVLGENSDVTSTESEGELIARTLKEYGINLNFAPVVDIAEDMETSIIGNRERSFGTTKEIVINHAEAYIKGHQKHNVLTCCKHFPGLGSALGDTHYGFVDATDTWKSNEVVPYQYLISKDLCPMIMTTHVFNGAFDEKYPATLSRKTINDYLRNELGFDGVVISDDMQMQSISDHYSLKESLRLGIEAGLDMFCFGNNLLKEAIKADDAIQVVKELVEDGIVTEGRIEASVKRILKLKRIANLPGA